MGKVFTKLHIGDTVATNGTRVFKKLTTEEVTPDEPSLPVWNGTDLSGTTWYPRDYWPAEAGYGVFDVAASLSLESGTIALINKICIGYSPESIGSENLLPTSDSISVQYNAPDKFYRPTEKITRIYFLRGTDATNPRLIDWLLENGRLTSHQMPTDSL